MPARRRPELADRAEEAVVGDGRLGRREQVLLHPTRQARDGRLGDGRRRELVALSWAIPYLR